MSSNLGAAGVGEQGMQSLFPCSSHTIWPRAVEVNTAEEEERKSNSTGERRCLEDTSAAFEPEFSLWELT